MYIYIYPIIYRYGCGIYIYICISHFHTSPIILPGMSRVLVENGIFSKELLLALHRFSDQWCLGLRHRASMKIRYKKYSFYQAQTGLIWWIFVSAAWLSTITIVYVDIFTKYIEIGRYIQSYIYICTIIHIYICCLGFAVAQWSSWRPCSQVSTLSTKCERPANGMLPFDACLWTLELLWVPASCESNQGDWFIPLLSADVFFCKWDTSVMTVEDEQGLFVGFGS